MPYLDILLFAIVAFYLVTRLGKTLGEHSHDDDRANVEHTWAKTFADKKQQQIAKKSAQKSKPKTTQQTLEQDMGENLAGSVKSGFKDIADADPNFDAENFINGSKRAFEMVLTAYVNGDKQILRNLLDNKLYTTFSSVIDIRTGQGHTAKNDLVGIDSVTPISAKLNGKIACVELQFVTQQINVTTDENDDVVDGHPQAIDTITDIWTFERDVKQSAPNWLLTHTRTVDE